MHSSQPTSLPPDEEIIQGLRVGDERMLETLVAAYWHRLVRFADSVLGGAAGAEDVVQEAIVRLWSRRGELRVDGSFRSFLYTITRNAAIDERRRLGRREAVAVASPPPGPSDDPLEELSATELAQAAEAAISALPPRRQEVFRLARTEGLTYREIADVMGTSPQTVANQMSMALTDLHQALRPFLRDLA